MTVAPVRHGVPASPASRGPHGRLTRWAVRLSVLFGAVTAASIATIGIAYAAGVEGAVEDTRFGALLAATALVGSLGSLAAFVLAIVEKVRGERWTFLWLPLGVFPAIVLFVVLGEILWWE